MARSEDHYVQNGDIRLHYVLTGEGPVIIFQHGFPDDPSTYDYQVEEFSKDHTVICPTLRGYPPSDIPAAAEAYTPQVTASDLLAIVDDAKADKVIIVGHDIGGAAVQAFCLMYPSRVSALILINGPLNPIFVNLVNLDEEQQQLSKYTLPYFEYKQGDPKPDLHFIARHISDPQRQRAVLNYLTASPLHGMFNHYKAVFPAPPYGKRTDTAHMLYVQPTLIIWGLKDPYFSLKMLDGLPQWFTQTMRLVTLPDAGHWAFRDRPDRVNREIRSWLQLVADDGARSFLAGSLPLSFSLSARQLRLISALGTGVLVGTSLIVIIPEGVATLYSARSLSHGAIDARSAMSVESGAAYAPIASLAEQGIAVVPTYRRDMGIGDETSPFISTDPEPSELAKGQKEAVPPASKYPSHANSEEHNDPHAWVGVSLIAGFVLMYLIDTLPQYASSSARPQRFAVSLNQFSFNRRAPSVSSESAEAPNVESFSSTAHHSSPASSRATSTTVGLVIHAAADGIALGASSTNASNNLSLVIFLALMIHKAPAAFGLTTVLLKQGVSKRMARLHLIIFSLAAPVGALVTWLIIHLLGWATYATSTLRSNNTGSAEFATGTLLLFSGGTFLYVAMHTMQETGVASRHAHHDDVSDANGYAGVPVDMPYAAHAPASKPQKPALEDLLVTVAGMLLPLLTQWGHVH
ncbi:hypothetical protein MRB53_042009 [Persea americana]|nr:hypothetical protein MRB53_042009 [Persea americana]